MTVIAAKTSSVGHTVLSKNTSQTHCYSSLFCTVRKDIKNPHAADTEAVKGRIQVADDENSTLRV